MTAVTDQDPTEHTDQPDDHARKSDARKSDARKADDREADARTADARSADAREAYAREAYARKAVPGGDSTRGAPDGERAARTDSASTEAWDDGLIARRVNETAEGDRFPMTDNRSAVPSTVIPLVYEGPLRSRLEALHELVGLSRTRLDSRTLSEAGRVLDEASARRRLSGQHTVVAIAGATGSGKSSCSTRLPG